MPINLTVTKQEFRSQINNGDDFTLSSSDFATHLKGGVLENMQALFDVKLGWTSTLSTYFIQLNADGVTGTISDAIINWQNEGFTIGDKIKVSVPPGQSLGSPCTFTCEILTISGNVITFNTLVFVSSTIPIGVTNWQATTGYVTGITPLDSLVYKFGLIENSESDNYISKLAQVDQIYHVTPMDVGNPNVFVSGTSFGNNKAWVTGDMSATFTYYLQDGDLIYPELLAPVYSIKHEFKINPVYRDNELTSLQGGAIPPIDIFNGSKSLKYVFEVDFRTVLNNPNTSKIGAFDTSLGSVGYLDESFNGFTNDYSVASLVYSDSATTQQTTQIDVVNKTKVVANIQGTGLITAGMEVVVGHMALVDSTDYSNSANEYDTIWTSEDLRIIEGVAPVNGTIITNANSLVSSPNVLFVTFEIEFTPTQQLNLIDNQNYLLYVVIRDNTKTVNNGNKVVLRLDVNQYLKDSDITGLINLDSFQQWPHPEPYAITSQNGYQSGKLFIEDGQLCSFDFNINADYTDAYGVSQPVEMQSLIFKIVAYNTVTETWFVLRELNINLSSGVVQIIGGLQITQYNLNSTRGYILENTDIFNYLNLVTGTLDFGNIQHYHLEVGYKIPWQNWIPLIGADSVFYDSSMPNDNLNNNTSNYTFSNDYKLRFLADAVVRAGTIDTNYVFSSGNFEAYDYHKDDLDPDGWTCSIQTFDIDGNALGGNIINQQHTRLLATFTQMNPPTEPDAALYYGILRMETINSQNDAGISELSSIIEAPLSSLLMQETGSIRLATLIASGGGIELSGLIDTSLITLGTTYKYSAEIRKKILYTV